MAISISRFISISVGTILTILLGILTSSSIAEMSSFQLNKPVRVELGSGVILDPDRLEIRVVSIQDSRCPRNLRCYWGGEARVKFNLSQAEKNQGDLDLTLGTINPDYFYPNNIKQVGKYYLRLLEIAPYPVNSNNVEPNKVTQTVTLQVQKTPFKLKDANLDKVESFTEDTRFSATPTNLNYPSPVGYRAWLQVEQLNR